MKHLKKVVLGVVLFCNLLQGSAQPAGLSFQNARNLAMGDSWVSHLNALSGNPAALTFSPAWAVQASALQRFALAGLSEAHLAAGFTTPLGSWGVDFNYFGNAVFSRQHAGLAYARVLGKSLRLGVQMDVYMQQISEYESSAAFTGQVCVLAPFSDVFSFGLVLANPIRSSWKDGEQLPSFIQAGILYRPSTQVMLSAAVEKDFVYPARVKAGIEYMPSPKIAIRAGITTAPGSPSIGVGYQIAPAIRLDVGTRYHPYLGLSPAFTLSMAQATKQ